jgi:nucleoside-diphosphate-sugar epimerase
MAGSSGGVRPRRSAGTVAVTGAAGDLGSRVAERLVQASEVRRVVGLDVTRGQVEQVTWRRADVRDPALRSKLSGV